MDIYNNIGSNIAGIINRSTALDIYSLDTISKYNKIETLNGDTIIIPNYDLLTKYETIINLNCQRYMLDDDEIMRPELLSYRLYGTVSLWYLLLFINKIESPSKFTQKDILILNPNRISILTDIYNNEKESINNKDNPYEANDYILKDPNTKSKEFKMNNRKFYKPIAYDYEINNNRNITTNLMNIINVERSLDNFNYGDNINNNVLINDIKKQKFEINDNIIINNSSSTYTLKTSLVSTGDELLGFKPLYIGENLIFKIDDNIVLNLPKNDNIIEENLIDKIEINVNNISFKDSYTGLESLIYQLKLDNSNFSGKVKSTIKYKRKEITNEEAYNITNDNIIYFIVDTESTFGDIEDITITIEGSNSKIISYKKIEYAFDTYNIRSTYNDILKLELTYNSNNISYMKLLLGHKLKHYKQINPNILVATEVNTESLRFINNKTNIIAANDSYENILFNGNNFFNIYIEDSVDSDRILDINDFSISCLIGANSYHYNGSMGIFFKCNDDTKVTYLYTLNKINETKNGTTCYLNGLYKIYFNNTENIDQIVCDSNNLNMLKAVKLSSYKSEGITGNLNELTNIQIITEENSIKIYNNKNNNPIISFVDYNPIEKPSNGYKQGIYLYNIANPVIRDMTIREIIYN